jgi:glycosyltransferase involved in cell wall biosynthesis
VIPPARPPSRRPPATGRGGPAPGPLRGLRRLALVGGAQAHKGAEVLAAVVERLAGDGRGLAFTVYGGGEAALLRRLRRLPGVAVRGYYPAGALPGLLRRDRIDLALLLSIVPESYSLALSECRLAGVPVLAFDHGAVADRLRAEGGGLLVDLAAGAAGVAEGVAAIARGEAAVPPLAAGLDLEADAAGRVADRWLALYRELGCG